MASATFSSLLQLDFDTYPGREVELHKSVDRLRRGIDDVEKPLVGADLELLAALLVDVRRAVHGELLDPVRKRDRSTHACTGALGRVDDLARRDVEHAMIIGLEPDAYVLALHGPFRFFLGSSSSSSLFDNLCDDARSDGTTAFT